LIVYFFFVFFYPEALGHPDNYVPANPMVTPPSIVPEWYFLPMYAILRSIPYKTPGVLTMGLAVGALYLLPLVSKPIVRSGDNRPIFAILFWTFVVDCFLLGWVGSNHVETPWVECGQIATVYYFLFFFVLLPFATQVDNYYFSLSYRNEKLASKYITRLNVHTGECVGYGLARVGDDDSK
jgi:ubiquinol-cytochrome c reductase cytochrome b subunit